MYYNIRREVGSYYIPRENGTLIVASQMTKEQSRYSFSECIDVRVVRANDITLEQMEFILGKKVMVGDATPYMVEYFYETYNQQMQEQNINRSYEDNDYVFLIEFA